MSDKATRAEGGPRSITETRTRYVEPDTLRRLASAVIDVPAIVARPKVLPARGEN